MAVSAPDKEKDITPKISIIKKTKFIVSPFTNFVLLPERFFSFENCFFGSAVAHSPKCYHETVFVPESVTSSASLRALSRINHLASIDFIEFLS